jgi:hypothetical protein
MKNKRYQNDDDWRNVKNRRGNQRFTEPQYACVKQGRSDDVGERDPPDLVVRQAFEIEFQANGKQ